MESKQVQESAPVWLASGDLVSATDGRQRGTFQGRPVFVQTVATSGSGPDLDHTLGQLQSLSHSGEGLTRIIGFTKGSGEDDGQVCIVSEWNEDEVVLRELLLDRESEVSWKERAQLAEDLASLAALVRDKVENAQPVIDANHVLVHKQKKKAQLAGLRCANVAKGDDNELGADFGLLLVELITRQPPVRAQAGDSLVAFPPTAAGSDSLGSSASGIRLSVPTGGGHQRSRSIGNGASSPSLRSSSSGVQASTPQGSLSSTSSGVHLSPRGTSGGPDLSSSGSYARRGGLFSSDELKERKKEASMKESNWELVQVKAFTAWLNGYLARRDLKINNLQSDLQDGTLLNHFIEIVNSTKMRRWTAKPNSKITMLENLSIGLAYIQKDMAIKLVGIGAEDIYNGYLKLILGLVWSLFKGLQMRRLAAGGGGSMEEGLMKWVREHTEAMGVTPTDFKYGFRDGQAFAALISRYDPKLIDCEAIKDKSPEELLPLVFELAEKHVGVPSLLEPNDLLSGDPDERAIQLYVSLFFDAFSTRKETAEFDSIIEITPADESTLSTSDPITVPADCPIGLLELAKQCCRARPEERPSLSELKDRLHAVVVEIAQREEAAQKKEAEEAEKRDELARLRRLVDEKQAEIEGLKERLLETKKNENEEEREATKRKSEEEAKERENEEEVRRMKEVLHDAIEKMKDERREKEELEGRLKERERSIKENEEARTTLKNEYYQLVQSLKRQKEESESELKERSAKEKERSETEERETRRIREELQERLKEADDVIHTKEELIETLREQEKKSESEAKELRRAKEEMDERLKEREREIEALKDDREKETTKAKEEATEAEEEARRVREAMNEALAKAREEFRREREELESARTKERQRFEAEKEELERRITAEKNEEELKVSQGDEEKSEVEMTVRRLREQLSDALFEREEKAKEAEQLAESLKEKERLLDAKCADEERERRHSEAEPEQASQTAKREAEELCIENRRLREALSQSQIEADQARVQREIEADEVRQLREQLAKIHSATAATQEHLHNEKRSRPHLEAEQEINRLKHMLRELRAEASADHQEDEGGGDGEKVVDSQTQPKQTPSETTDGSDGSGDGGVEQSARGDKFGLFMMGVPPTIDDGSDDAASLVAGSTAAALCMTLASPIQRVKLLLQTQAEMVAAGRLLRPYAGVRDCFRRVVAEEGLLSLWRGNVAHLLRIVSANALGFVLKDRFKNVLHVDKERDGYWKWMAANVASGSAAGLVTVLCTFSLDYARTRLASDVLRVAHPGAGGGERQFSGLMDVYSQVQRREGTAGLYRGFTSSCVGVILYRGLYFGLYDSLKPVVLRGDLKDSVVASFVLGWGITLGAGLAAYPFDTICRRMMTTASEHRGGLMHTLTEIVEREGLAALWKGAAANMAYALIGAGLLVAYDRAVARAAAAAQKAPQKDTATDQWPVGGRVTTTAQC